MDSLNNLESTLRILTNHNAFNIGYRPINNVLLLAILETGFQTFILAPHLSHILLIFKPKCCQL